MPILDDTEIRELHAAALSASFDQSRRALMAGIDGEFVAGIPDAANARDQILVDLDELSKGGALADGNVPLAIWIANAAHLAGPRAEAAVFGRFVARVAVGARRPTGVAAVGRAPASKPAVSGNKASRDVISAGDDVHIVTHAAAPAPTMATPVATQALVSRAHPSAREHVCSAPESTDVPSSASSLVIIHGNELMVGQRRILVEDLTRIGRGGPDVDWDVDDRGISRQQCHVERRGDRWILRDLGSTNGTWLNENRLDGGMDRELRAGDRIRLGNNLILRFFTDEGAVTERPTTLFAEGPRDGLTGLLSRARVLDALSAEQAAAAQENRGICVLAILVDQMDRLDDDESEPIGDYVLQELARLLERTLPPGGLVGRLRGEAFLMVLRNEHERVSLHSAVRAHEWHSRGERLRVTISIGRSNHVPNALWRAEVAQADGGDCEVEGDEDESATLPDRSPARLMGGLGSLCAFEIGDEKAVIQLGQATIGLWQAQLGSLVLRFKSRFRSGRYDEPFPHGAIFNGHPLGRLSPLGGSLYGHPFARLPSERSEADECLRELQAKWASYPVPLLHQRTLTRSLRCATLTAAEVREHGTRSFDVLLERLRSRNLGSLPFPLEALGPIAQSHSSEYVSAKTLCDGIETALRFITAVELAALRDVDDASVRAELAAALSGHRTGRLTMAAWRALAFQLAPLAVRYLQGPVQEAARLLAEPLAAVVEDAVTRSGRYLSHTTPQHESSYAEDRLVFGAVLDRLADAMRPLARLRLVSVAGMDGYGDDGETTIYRLYLHQGPSERFPLVTENLTPKLAKNDWCYLVGAPDQPALLLAPMVAARPCVDCGKIEVFMADSLVLGPKGAKVSVKAITTAHDAEVAVPASESIRLLHEAITH